MHGLDDAIEFGGQLLQRFRHEYFFRLLLEQPGEAIRDGREDFGADRRGPLGEKRDIVRLAGQPLRIGHAVRDVRTRFTVRQRLQSAFDRGENCLAGGHLPLPPS